jgi:hypothetical protein
VKFLAADDWFTITGRGRVAAVDTRQLPYEDAVLNIGEVVEIDGGRYRITGIEYARTLTDPPRILPTVCLRVAAWP